MAFDWFRKKPSTDSIDNGVKLITVAHPTSPTSEEFRTIRTNIHFMSVDHEIKTLAFTSAHQSEGKATVTANVAVTWALEGKKVLFIDADMRRPTIHKTFGLSNRQGLTTILSSHDSQIRLDTFIQESGIDNMSILTSGPIPPNPSELLSSERMNTFVQSVRNAYDIVVLDVPPILEVPDTQVLSAHLDGLVLVVREGKTRKDDVARTVDMLRLSKTNILGYVMNDHKGKNSGYGYGYGYGYTSDK